MRWLLLFLPSRPCTQLLLTIELRGVVFLLFRFNGEFSNIKRLSVVDMTNTIGIGEAVRVVVFPSPIEEGKIGGAL